MTKDTLEVLKSAIADEIDNAEEHCDREFAKQCRDAMVELVNIAAEADGLEHSMVWELKDEIRWCLTQTGQLPTITDIREFLTNSGVSKDDAENYICAALEVDPID